MTSTYRPAFESFVAPARARAEVWRTLLGLCAIGAIYAGFGAGFLYVLSRWVGRIALDGSTPISMLIFLATFLGMALAPMLVVTRLHGRKVGTLFGYTPRVIRDFAKAAVLVACLFAVNLGLWVYVFDAVPNLPTRYWLWILPIAALALLIQTGAEELVFRGYLQQQFAARARSPWIWMIGPSLLFTAAHYDPSGLGPNLWPTLGAIMLFGVVAADLTARTGSIGAAWGFHFINNCMAILVLAVDGPLTGLALFRTPYTMFDPIMTWLLIGDMITIVLAWLLLRRLLAR